MARSNLAEKLESPDEQDMAKRTLSKAKNREAMGQVIPFRPNHRPRISNETEGAGDNEAEIIPFSPADPAQEAEEEQATMESPESEDENIDELPESIAPEEEEDTANDLRTAQQATRLQEEAAEEEEEAKTTEQEAEEEQEKMAAPMEEGGEEETQGKKKSEGKKEEELSTNITEEEEEDTSNQMKDEKNKDKKKSPLAGLGQQAEEPVEQATQAATSELLEQSWINLIDSCGLTLIYINVHLIAKYFASSKYFVDFGEEWSYKFNKMTKAGKTVMKAKLGALKWAEIILVIFLDVIVGLVLCIAMLAAMLPYILFIAQIGSFWALLGTASSAVTSLIK